MGINFVAVLLGFSFFYSLFSLFLFCNAVNNNLTKSQSLKDGDALVSVDKNFELGFFSPEDSSLRYLGIRYHRILDQPAIWVANRQNPISDTNGVMTFSDDGKLVVKDGNDIVVWSSSNNSSTESNNTVAVLQPTGNLLVFSSVDDVADTNKAYWQSFDHPTDTYLPDMNVNSSSEAGENRAFTSWKSETDPSPGNFTMGVDPRGAPQIVIWEETRRRWRSGHWDGQIFTGVPSMAKSTNYQYGFKLDTGDGGNNYFTYNPSNKSDLLRFQITWEGYEEQLKWNENEQKWDLIQSQPGNDCEKYNYCGNFSVCSITDSRKCNCMKGFEPRYPDQWSRRNWTGGCVRSSPLQCQNSTIAAGESTDDFKMFSNLKLPDFADVVTGVSLDTCKESCLKKCSCNAFALIGGIGCMTWIGDLVDLQQFDKGGNSLYLRLSESEFDSRRLSSLLIAVIVVAGVVFLALSIWLLWMLKTKLKVLPTASSVSWMGNSEVPVSDVSKIKECSTDFSGQADLSNEVGQVNASDLPLFNFNTVAAATDNFSEKNKLGQGGFGHVYKGKLPGGEEIAVKRLSRISGQGLEEFKNEIILIAKLQHRNLVRLLGCCIQGEENLLLYEYMPNKSLDCFIFDPTKQAILNWRKRLEIIEGIARGLLYLHRDSRLRIIHRDLKASNILLDEDMNPKISDFGMARIFGGNQHEANTNRVVGTFGYMSPEYAMEGLFSVKSDVYSFGVLVLEIVSGRRNTSFRSSDHVSLIAYAWEMWSEGRGMELVDASIRKTCCEAEVLRCIQVGMLCVQDSAIHRPTMASVVLQLESKGAKLPPLPRQPTFTSRRASIDTEIHVDGRDLIVSSNDMSMSMVVGR